MIVHNLMEEIVSHCLRDLMQHREGMDGLSDDQLSDIMALALNRLPPKYVATSKGEMFAKTQLRAQVETDVYRELAYAVNKVTRNSRKRDFDRKN